MNVFMETGEITKTGTLDTTLQNPAGEANMYVQFGYFSLKICNYTQGQVSGSMNTDAINITHPSQQSTKEGLNNELEGDYILSNTII